MMHRIRQRLSHAKAIAAAAVAVAAIWLVATVDLARSGAFAADPGEPPVATLLAILAPPALFAATLRIEVVRRAVLAIDPVWLSAMQGLRILGAGFLFVYAFGHLPALFAQVAGWGDVLVALLAPLVAASLASDPSFIRSKAFLGFHVLGLLDFVGAVGSGLLVRGTIPVLGLQESTAALGELPLVLIPCFAVPLWICLHTAALVQRAEALRRLRGAAMNRPSARSAGAGGDPSPEKGWSAWR